MVDPHYNFEREIYRSVRIRQRREAYAHEMLSTAPYDGILVSMAMAGFRAGAIGRASSRYTEAQRYRLLYGGVRRFFRLDEVITGKRIETMGDTGAYSYAHEENPPITVAEALDFYDLVGFDYALSPDHIIPGFHHKGEIPQEWTRRRDISLCFAQDFLIEHAARGSRSVPIGVAQGWSPSSYANAVSALEKMGYHYVALGGLAPLRTRDILPCVEAVASAKASGTRLHLLGLARPAHLAHFSALGVVSIDTTMPLRQAFKDDKHNYHTPERHFLAIRVPSSEKNVRLEKHIRSGKTDRTVARRLEQASLNALRRFDKGKAKLDEVLEAVAAYELLFNGRNQTAAYRVLLEEQPWRSCPCAICKALGIEVVLFRGAERNKRRGFHNLFVFHRQLQQNIYATA